MAANSTVSTERRYPARGTTKYTVLAVPTSAICALSVYQLTGSGMRFSYVSEGGAVLPAPCRLRGREVADDAVRRRIADFQRPLNSDLLAHRVTGLRKVERVERPQVGERHVFR